nr:hypothetical protein [Rhodovulum sp. 12E13]
MDLDAIFRVRRIPAEYEFANINRVRENAVNLIHAPKSSSARAEAVLIQPDGQFLDSQRPLLIVPFEEELEDLSYDCSLLVIHCELLLDLVAPHFGSLEAIAEGRRRPVPEALPRIFLARPLHMFRVFSRLIFVEQRDNPAAEVAHGIGAHILGYALDLDAILPELSHEELAFDFISAEAAE